MSLTDVLSALPSGSPEEALARRVDFDRLPQHIAIIMDGNGRWAAGRHLPRVEGHRAGIDAVRDTVETSARLGISGLDALRVLGRELEAAGRRDLGAHGPPAPLPAPRVEDAAQEQRPLPRHRPAGSAEPRDPGRALAGRDPHGGQHRSAVQHRVELRRPGGDRGRGAPRDARRHRPGAARRSDLRVASSTPRASPIRI